MAMAAYQGQCLPKAARLSKQNEIQAVFQRRRYSLASGPLRLLVLPRAEALGGRICLVVAKRVVRKAVQRNRIKRKLREIIRQSGVLNHGLDWVLIIRPHEHMEKALPHTFQKLCMQLVQKGAWAPSSQCASIR